MQLLLKLTVKRFRRRVHLLQKDPAFQNGFKYKQKEFRQKKH